MRRIMESSHRTGLIWTGRTIGAGLLLLPGACALNSGGAAEGAGSSPGAEASATPPSAVSFRELADNRNGVPVFSDNKGSALTRGEDSRIPYATAVEVDCVAPNLSGITSINALYRIVRVPNPADPNQNDTDPRHNWTGDFVPANTMDNNAGLGPNPVDLDLRVPPCAPGTPGVAG